MKITFWDMNPFILVDVYQRFVTTYNLHLLP
jgi:hypothetical protein